MARRAYIDAPFGDGQHRFRLGIGELEELQEKTDAGPVFLQRRIVSDGRVADVRETIRLGLIGGGMAADAALKLVERYAVPGAWRECVLLAAGIVTAALDGVEDEPPGKPGAEAATGGETS